MFSIKGIAVECSEENRLYSKSSLTNTLIESDLEILLLPFNVKVVF